MEEKKSELPVLMTAALMQLKINTEVTKNKLTIADLEKRALALVKNEDNLKIMQDLLDDLKKVDDLTETTHKTVKQPYWDAGKACDVGKKLVLEQTERIRGMFKDDLNRLLTVVADRKAKADLKKDQDRDILEGIEANLISFAALIVAAVTLKQLNEIINRLNLEKSPSRAKKYGEFHAQACERYDTVLLPIIQDQKIKVEKIEKLKAKLLEAEAHNDPDKMDELNVQIDSISNEILQNHAVVQEAVLNQESFLVVEATEILPDFKIKRTNSSFEIVDVEKAFKHARSLLEITIDGKAAREEFRALMEKGEFEGKDEVIVNGIKFTAIRVREAL